MTTHMEVGVHRHRQFQVHPWNQVKKRHTKASQYFVTLDLILSNARQKCVANALTISLLSGLRSSLLHTDSKVRAGANLCWRYACFSLTSEGSGTFFQWKHWSGNCWVCQTCSASPVREKWMHKRNSTVQGSTFKFQKLTEKLGVAQAAPAAPLPTAVLSPAHFSGSHCSPVNPN